jgi:ribonuclease P protein component
VALPRTHRLRQRRDFDSVYRKGIRRKSKNLTLRALRRKGTVRSPSVRSAASTQPVESGLPLAPIAQPPTRIGITISQKVSKRAVIRNRIRRQIRAALRQLLPQFKTGWDLVIVVDPQAIQCDYRQFLQELEQLLIDAEVLHGHS